MARRKRETLDEKPINTKERSEVVVIIIQKKRGSFSSRRPPSKKKEFSRSYPSTAGSGSAGV
jgi:hypothetical protein